MSKLTALKTILAEMEGILVAFSGGVDSSFLLKVAHELHPEKLVAVTAVSETYPDFELANAKRVAAGIGAKHLIINTNELEQAEFSQNSPERCYYCKKELFSKLKGLATELALAVVIDGANADDVHDYRPGMRACKELGIRSPLKEAGLTKEEIRGYSRELGLPTWDQPAYACLASRFPYGEAITIEGLRRVAAGEAFLRSLGFKQLRLRDYGKLARIEIPLKEFDLLGKYRIEVIAKLKGLGYRYITLDMEGYRSGSMNEVLN